MTSRQHQSGQPHSYRLTIIKLPILEKVEHLDDIGMSSILQIVIGQFRLPRTQVVQLTWLGDI
jgi:hypothetical protein